MAEEQQTRINVEKAQLPLQANESVNAFMEALRQGVQKYLTGLYALGERSWIYTCDVFENAVVAEISRDGPPRTRDLVQVPFTRQGTGFNFGKPIPVVRRITYVPKTTTPQTITATKAEAKQDSFWSGAL